MIETQVYHKFFHALLEGDRKECSAISGQLMEGDTDIMEVYENIFKRAMYDIGDLWEKGKISVATEHMASAITEALINEYYYRVLSGKKQQKTAVVACVENEYHQIGIKMVSDIFELRGWNALFLGANTPTSELIKFIRQVQPHLLALSLSLHFHLPIMEKMIAAIREEFPDLLILVGGQGFRHGGKDIIAKYSHVVYRSDLNQVDAFIQSLNT